MKRQLILGGFSLSVLLMILSSGSVVATTGTWTKSTNITSPTTLVTNVAYNFPNGLDYTNATYYNQISLQANRIYFFLWGTYADRFELRLDGPESIFEYKYNIINSSTFHHIVIFKTTMTGLFNFTAKSNQSCACNVGCSGMGFFEIPELSFGSNYNAEYGFSSDPFAIEYKTFLSSPNVFKMATNDNSIFYFKVPNSAPYNFVLTEEIGTNFQSASNLTIDSNADYGTYLFYNRHNSAIPTIDAYEPSDNNDNSIDGFSNSIVLISSVAVISIIMKKRIH